MFKVNRVKFVERNYAASLGSIRASSNFYEHCEAVVNFEKIVNNKVEGQYRKKKLL